MSLFESASLVVTPNGTKASKLYSVKPADGSGDMTVTRATTATRVNASGIIESVATNVPRLDYTGSTCPSILIEPQRTNLLLNSVLAGTGSLPTSWSFATTSTGSSAPIASTISTIGQAYTFITSASRQAFSQSFNYVSGTTYCLSIYVENVEGTIAVNQVVNLFGTGTQTFYKGNELITSTTPVVSGSRYTSVLVCTANITSTVRIGNGCVANSTGTIRLSMPQFEAGSNATSYIPTTTASVTRNTDVISKTGISSLIGQTEGTIFLDTKYSSSASTSLRSFKVFGLSDEIGLALNSGNLVRTFVNGASDTITTAPKTDLRIKIAFAYNNSGVVLFVNGVQYALPNGGSQIITSLDSISFSGLGSQLQQANINSEILFKTRLTNAELATLTTL